MGECGRHELVVWARSILLGPRRSRTRSVAPKFSTDIERLSLHADRISSPQRLNDLRSCPGYQPRCGSMHLKVSVTPQTYLGQRLFTKTLRGRSKALNLTLLIYTSSHSTIGLTH